MVDRPKPPTGQRTRPKKNELLEGKLVRPGMGDSVRDYPDVAIYFSVKSSNETGGWSKPQAVVTSRSRLSCAEAAALRAQSVGNAVAPANDVSGLWLVYVGGAGAGRAVRSMCSVLDWWVDLDAESAAGLWSQRLLHSEGWRLALPI